jgi:prenyltransferase beta subunit
VKQSTQASQEPAPAGKEPTRADGAENAPLAEEMTPELDEAIQRGFEHLRRIQKVDGSFGQGRFGEHAGITSLAAIALMADGNVPGRGEFGDCVQKALEFVLRHSSETGLIVSDDMHGPMYGHGFATLFLGEVYGMNQEDDRVRDALVRAVQLIVSSQNDEGGWRYNPVPADADVSVTICEIMALRSARNAGIKVPKSTIDDAIRYVRSCQNDDGGFRYMKDVGGSLWPRTAAGVASLFYAGVYEDESIDRGLDYLSRNAFPRGPGGMGGGFAQQHYFYGHYYAVQAMYLAGGDRWKAWWPAIRQELLAKQNADGSWTDQQVGDAYGTAMALIVLQMPKRYLPIFQR